MRDVDEVLDMGCPRDEDSEWKLFLSCLLDPTICDRSSTDLFYLEENGLLGMLFILLDDARVECEPWEDPTKLFFLRMIGRKKRIREVCGGDVSSMIGRKLTQVSFSAKSADLYIARCREIRDLRYEMDSVVRRLRKVALNWEEYQRIGVRSGR